jgi:hypothetical protein
MEKSAQTSESRKIKRRENLLAPNLSPFSINGYVVRFVSLRSSAGRLLVVIAAAAAAKGSRSREIDKDY